MPILSKAYVRKHWTGLEFNAAFALKRTVLPIWHGISHAEVRKFSPIVADVKSISSAVGPRGIAEAIKSLLERDKRTIFCKTLDERAGPIAFWAGAESYIIYLLGLAPANAEEQMAAVRLNGKSFLEFYEEQFPLKRENISGVRAVFDDLTDDEFITAMLEILQDNGDISGGWRPPTEGWEKVSKKLRRKGRAKRRATAEPGAAPDPAGM